MGLFESTRWINWELETYPLPQDLVFLPCFAFLFASLRLFLDRYVFEALGRHLLGHASQKVETRDKRKKINKFKESAWKFVYFLSAELLAVSITYNEPWFTNTKYFWVGPGNQVWPDQKIKLKLKGLYMYAAGFYMYSSFALVFWETRRSDFVVSMAHHIATVILILLSYIFRFARVGSAILAIHEGSDVLLELAKMSKYSGFECMASSLFVVFVLSWTILRLIYFPLWIIWSTSYEVLLTLDKEKHMVDGSMYYYLFNTLLICLLVCHIYWWVLMIRMLIKQIKARGKLSDDVRSDSEDDDEHED
ncbi:ceramide synthase 1 LOH3 isoform X2 [Ziziphus jujuba]|uniref:Ceramide synthase 1 LOH3 isoform X2 n=1 Tax=Ziziphus jujuba TaxID=326968 RepID=A0ABM3IKL1_ZIZJJ|nr:ceramide synthase 1 LOH3 isoform X2 [Ziziphus jujuba]